MQIFVKIGSIEVEEVFLFFHENAKYDCKMLIACVLLEHFLLYASPIKRILRHKRGEKTDKNCLPENLNNVVAKHLYCLRLAFLLFAVGGNWAIHTSLA
jgi:hypothetical protein